jgi:predicted transcriptional regulator
MTKEHLAEAVKDLPDTFSIDDLIERLILIESFEKGREQYEQGKTFTHEEVGKRLEKWLG